MIFEKLLLVCILILLIVLLVFFILLPIIDFLLIAIFDRTLRKCHNCGKRKLHWSGVEFNTLYTVETFHCSSCGLFTHIKRIKNEIEFATKEFDDDEEDSVRPE